MRSISELEQMLAQSAVVNRIAFFDPSIRLDIHHRLSRVGKFSILWKVSWIAEAIGWPTKFVVRMGQAAKSNKISTSETYLTTC